MWVHLDNPEEIAIFGTHLDPIYVVEMHQYQLVIKIDEYKDDFESLQNKLKEVCGWIEDKIYPKLKEKEEYELKIWLFNIYCKFYQEFVCGTIKEKVTAQQFKKLEEIVTKMYLPIIEKKN